MPLLGKVFFNSHRLEQGLVWLSGWATFFDMTVEEIKAAIPHLKLEERAEIARCLHGWDDDEWDVQMKRDLAEGKLNALLTKVDTDIDRGKYSDLP